MARGIAVWLLIMLAETAHGVVRGMFLSPHLGEDAAARIGWPVGMVLVVLISVLAIRWTQISGPAALLRLGAVWAVLTVAFELMIGALRGLDHAQLADALNPRTGTIAYSALVMLLAPLMADWLRRRIG
jgi:hypothetical protein